MIKKIRIVFISVLFLFSGAASIFADTTPIENLYSYKLKNGLELYVAENHTAPLTYIEICVKGGGIGQTKDNAGLFHLYEHMMFKGNNLYKNAEEIQNALSALGVTNWNGTTNTEYVNYFFTVPSDKTKEGLEFWNAAIRNPKMDLREFETEKKVVLSEIEGDSNEPGMISYNFLSERLFPEAPWKRSPGGTSDVVKKATISQLKKIQKEYYIPNNSALFVGGDVNPDEVYEMVNKIWGSWKKGKDPWINQKNQLTQQPVSETEYYVIPYDKVSDQMAQVSVFLRGPDGAFNEEETLAADLLFSLTQNPQSSFKQSLINNPNFAIPDPNYCGINYLTQSRLGLIESDAIMLSPQISMPQRAKLYVQTLPELIKAEISDGSEESNKKIEIVKQRFFNGATYDMETAQGLLNQLKFWWTVTSSEYYYNYIESMYTLDNSKIQDFYNKYIQDYKPVVVVYVNPEVYEATKSDYENEGFVEIKKEENK